MPTNTTTFYHVQPFLMVEWATQMLEHMAGATQSAKLDVANVLEFGHQEMHPSIMAHLRRYYEIRDNLQLVLSRIAQHTHPLHAANTAYSYWSDVAAQGVDETGTPVDPEYCYGQFQYAMADISLVNHLHPLVEKETDLIANQVILEEDLGEILAVCGTSPKPPTQQQEFEMLVQDFAKPPSERRWAVDQYAEEDDLDFVDDGGGPRPGDGGEVETEADEQASDWTMVRDIIRTLPETSVWGEGVRKEANALQASIAAASRRSKRSSGGRRSGGSGGGGTAGSASAGGHRRRLQSQAGSSTHGHKSSRMPKDRK